MRLRWGRPDLASFEHLSTTPSATPTTPVTASFLGVTTLLFEDGGSAILTDGFFTRPSLLATVAAPLRTHPDRVGMALARAGIDSLDAVVCSHSHYDHALDSAYVAQRTEAKLIGGASTILLGTGSNLPDTRLMKVADGEQVTAGNFTVKFVLSEHSHPDRFRGIIDRAVTQPARVGEYRCGETWSILLRHEPTGHTALVHSSANFRHGALKGHSADVVYLAIGQLGRQPWDFIGEYWRETVTAVGARRVVLTHWDDFFRPLTVPLRALPYMVDNMDASVRVLTSLAHRDDVALDLPIAFRRTDPWAS